MDKQLRQQILSCRRMAEEARIRAQSATCPDERQHFESFEALWSALANSAAAADRSKVYSNHKAKTRKGDS